MCAGQRIIWLIGAPSVALALLAAGCEAPTQKQAAQSAPPQSADAAGWIAQSESIVILESPKFVYSWAGERRKMEPGALNACASQDIVRKHPGIRIISQGEFVRTAFPDLPSENAPISLESMKLLSESDVVRERIAALNIRYLVYASAVTEIRNDRIIKDGVALGYVAAGVVGKTWEKQSDYSLAVYDLKKGRQTASEGSVTGSGWYVVGLIVVVPIAAGWSSPTETQACDDLANRVLAALESMTPGPQ